MSSVVGMFDHTPCRSLHIPIPVPFRSVGLLKILGSPWSVSIDAGYGGSWPATDRWTVEVSRQIDDILTPARGLVRQSRALGGSVAHAVVFTPAFEVLRVSITSVYPVLIASSNGQPH